jgi:hypothetical protein
MRGLAKSQSLSIGYSHIVPFHNVDVSRMRPVAVPQIRQLKIVWAPSS